MNRYPWLDAYLLAKPGAEKDYKAEWAWLRYRVAGRLFAAVCCPGAQYGVYAGHEMVILKCEPALAELFRMQYADVLPGSTATSGTGTPSFSTARCRTGCCAACATSRTGSWWKSSPESCAPNDWRPLPRRPRPSRGRDLRLLAGCARGRTSRQKSGRRALARRPLVRCDLPAFRRGRDRGRRLPAYRGRSVRR